MVCSEHELVDVQMLSSAELIAPEEGIDVELTLGPNWEVAAMRGPVHDERLISLSSELRNDSHPELTSVGMRGFALGVAAAVEDAYAQEIISTSATSECISLEIWGTPTVDCAKTTVIRAERTMNFI